VVILCGGQGMRLREKTESIPKPLVEIGGRPILWHLMKIYAHYGFTDFVLCLGYKGEQIQAFCEQLDEDWHVTAVDTGQDTSTGGRLRLVRPYVTAPTFFATYADGLAKIALPELMAFHRRQGTVGTMTCVRPRTHFGLVDLGPDHRVVGYREKPQLETWVNGGFFVFEQAIFNYIEGDEVLERQPLERLTQERHLSAYEFEGFWVCMDTYKDTQTLNQLWEANQADWKVWRTDVTRRVATTASASHRV
jgi:glucose-1-phosphate cytidylyltransferase